MGAPFCVQVAGSSLALLHIDQRTLKLTMACCGGANAVLGELVHGLAAQVITALSEVAVLLNLPHISTAAARLRVFSFTETCVRLEEHSTLAQQAWTPMQQPALLQNDP